MSSRGLTSYPVKSLSRENDEFLKKRQSLIKIVPLFLLLSSSLFGVAVYKFTQELLILGLAGVSSLIMIIAGYVVFRFIIFNNLEKDLKEGKKHIVRGTIVEKNGFGTERPAVPPIINPEDTPSFFAWKTAIRCVCRVPCIMPIIREIE